MKQSNRRDEMTALRAVALRDLDAVSDVDLLEELATDGVEVGALAARVRAKLDQAASAVLRAHVAKERSTKKLAPDSVFTIRPVIDRLKELVQGALQGRPDLAVAFRDGKKQSDSDWESLYDDLVALGIIKNDPKNNGD